MGVLAEIIYYIDEDKLTESEIFYIYNTTLDHIESIYKENLDKQEVRQIAPSAMYYTKDTIERMSYNPKDETTKSRLNNVLFQISQKITVDELESLVKKASLDVMKKHLFHYGKKDLL